MPRRNGSSNTNEFVLTECDCSSDGSTDDESDVNSTNEGSQLDDLHADSDSGDSLSDYRAYDNLRQLQQLVPTGALPSDHPQTENLSDTGSFQQPEPTRDETDCQRATGNHSGDRTSPGRRSASIDPYQKETNGQGQRAAKRKGPDQSSQNKSRSTTPPQSQRSLSPYQASQELATQTQNGWGIQEATDPPAHTNREHGYGDLLTSMIHERNTVRRPQDLTCEQPHYNWLRGIHADIHENLKKQICSSLQGRTWCTVFTCDASDASKVNSADIAVTMCKMAYSMPLVNTQDHLKTEYITFNMLNYIHKLSFSSVINSELTPSGMVLGAECGNLFIKTGFSKHLLGDDATVKTAAINNSDLMVFRFDYFARPKRINVQAESNTEVANRAALLLDRDVECDTLLVQKSFTTILSSTTTEQVFTTMADHQQLEQIMDTVLALNPHFIPSEGFFTTLVFALSIECRGETLAGCEGCTILGTIFGHMQACNSMGPWCDSEDAQRCAYHQKYHGSMQSIAAKSTKNFIVGQSLKWVLARHSQIYSKPSNLEYWDWIKQQPQTRIIDIVKSTYIVSVPRCLNRHTSHPLAHWPQNAIHSMYEASIEEYNKFYDDCIAKADVSNGYADAPVVFDGPFSTLSSNNVFSQLEEHEAFTNRVKNDCIPISQLELLVHSLMNGTLTDNTFCDLAISKSLPPIVYLFRTLLGPLADVMAFTFVLASILAPNNRVNVHGLLNCLAKFHQVFRDIILTRKFREQTIVLYSPCPRTYKSTVAALLAKSMGKYENINFGPNGERFIFAACAKDSRQEPRVLVLDDCSVPQWKTIDIQLRAHLDGNVVSLEAKNKDPITKALPPMIVTTNSHPTGCTTNVTTRLKVIEFVNPFGVTVNLLEYSKRCKTDHLYLWAAVVAEKMFSSISKSSQLGKSPLTNREAVSKLIASSEAYLNHVVRPSAAYRPPTQSSMTLDLNSCV